jgi:hypothetical protein
MRLFAILLTFVSAIPALAADMPTGDSLLAHFAEVTGGEAAWSKVRSSVMDGAIDMAGRNFVGTVQIVEQGEKSYMSMEFAGIGKVEECYNGVDAWEVSAVSGPRLIEGDEKASIRRASSIAILTGWRNLYSKATTLRSEDIDGHPAWRVEMIPKEGKPETFWFDRDSGLLVRVSSVLSSVLGEINSDLRLSDYRAVDSILTPFLMREQVMGQDIVMRFTQVVFNGAIPPGRFDPPAEIKSLLSKQRQ